MLVTENNIIKKNIWEKATFLNEQQIDLTQTSKEGQEKAAAWVERTGLQPLEILKYRLNEDGLSYSDFVSILSNPSPRFMGEEEPAWFKILNSVFNNKEDIVLTDDDINPEEREKAPFFNITLPFLIWSKKDILNRLYILKDNFNQYPISKRVLSSILKPIYQSLLSLSCQTLILELNTKRVQRKLVGSTKEERFDNFISSHITKSEDIVSLLEKYPVLGRLMITSMKNIINSRLEAIENYLVDYIDIQEKFGSDYNELISIEGNVGDMHNNGRSVLILSFLSGKKLIYKPRSLAIDQHFQEFLSWMNDKGAKPKFKIMKVIDRTTYGWQEFIETKECMELEQVSRFYQRQGGFLAISYLLNATDFHSENIIASGEHPFFIDLESLFQNRIPAFTKKNASQLASNKLMNSVLRTGLLPVSLFKNGVLKGIEVSGLGGYKGQAIPKSTYGFVNVRTDEMRMEKKQFYLEEGNNRPSINGKTINSEEYIQEITEGFYNTYQLFLSNKQELKSESGPIAKFKNDSVRAIIRDTQTYGTMLEAGMHPKNLKHGLLRVQLFDFMWRFVKQVPKISKVVPSENGDLLQGDIPSFITTVSSCHIWDNRGKKIKNFYEQDSLSATFILLERLNQKDCQEQIQMIKTSMATMIKKWDAKLAYRDPMQKQVNTLATRDEFITAAIDIGERLEKKAIWGADGKTVTWIGLGADEHDQWLFTPLDSSLYDGLMGVTIFYAYLSKETGIEKFEKIARASLNSAREFLNADDTIKSLSAFHGYSSAIYGLMHLSNIWEEDELLDEAIYLLDKVEPLIEKDVLYDLLSGSAGTILVCLRLYSLTGEKKALDIAEKCGRHLLKNAQPLEIGCGWSFNIGAGHEPIAGLSHGSAGIAWALIELTHVTKDDRYLEKALQTIEFERTLFNEEEGNWTDTRFLEKREELGLGIPVQWCHGAAGITLGRLMIQKYYSDPKIDIEIKVGIDTTLKTGFGGSHCLCHGDFGNLEVLLSSGMRLNDEYLKGKAYEFGTKSLLDAKQDGWFCGIPQEEETPSLMLGLSGIGYGLLRLANPDKVPPVVLLAPPVK